MWLMGSLKLPAINKHQGTWCENRVYSFVKSLHFCTAFRMLAFWVFAG